MIKSPSDFPVGTFIRTCNECGNCQQDKRPAVQGEFTKAYEFRKCKHCGSEALDYGSETTPTATEEIE